METKLAIFDFAGTLAEEPTKNIPALFKGLNELGSGWSPKDPKKFLGSFKESLSTCTNWDDLAEKTAESLGQKPNDQLVDLLKKNVVFSLFKDVEKIIESPIRKAILTDISPFLVNSDLWKDFLVFAPQITGYRKPDQRAFECVLSYFGVNAKEVIMVGNSLKDVVPAAEMGIPSFLIDREGNIPEKDIPKNITKTSSWDEIEGYMEYLKCVQ